MGGAERISGQVTGRGLPPVESWDPPLAGDMDLRIARDGTWYHEGSPIRRPALVRLFSRILRRDADGEFYLVTPVEKWRIRVDDAPFLAVLLECEGRGPAQRLRLRTNLGDEVTAGPEHPIRVDHGDDGRPAPYVHLRGGLWALISRALFLELAGLGEPAQRDGKAVLGVWSDGGFFELGPLEEP